jgi:hypothetical protein
MDPCTARRASSTVEAGHTPVTCPRSAGLRCSNVRPSDDGTHAPPIQLRKTGGAPVAAMAAGCTGIVRLRRTKDQ